LSGKEAGMRNLLKRRKDDCEHLQDLLESSATEGLLGGSVEELVEILPAEERAHIAECGSCQEAARDLLATRGLLKVVGSPAEDGGPWFARRVLLAIAARERELAFLVSPWSMVPRFASRLAWASAIVLLAGSTWLYESPKAALNKQPAAASAQEYLFEAPQPPMNQDDVLMSMAERNP
jgi:hypothetical protein